MALRTIMAQILTSSRWGSGLLGPTLVAPLPTVRQPRWDWNLVIFVRDETPGADFRTTVDQTETLGESDPRDLVIAHH